MASTGLCVLTLGPVGGAARELMELLGQEAFLQSLTGTGVPYSHLALCSLVYQPNVLTQPPPVAPTQPPPAHLLRVSSNTLSSQSPSSLPSSNDDEGLSRNFYTDQDPRLSCC